MNEQKTLGERYFLVARQESGIDLENGDFPAAFPDPVAATAGYNMAVLLFHRMRKQSALNIIRSIQRSPNMPESLMCEASLLEMNILLDFRQSKPIIAVVRTFQTKPWWATATLRQKETAERLIVRARAMVSVEKFVLQPHHLDHDSLSWLVCHAKVDARNGEFKKSISRLLEARAKASKENQVMIDNALGCVYASAVKNHNFAEAFFRSAMKEAHLENPILGSFGSVPRAVLVYNLALCLLSQGKYEDAFKLFVLTVPYFQHLPRFWLRLAECCTAALLSDKSTLGNKNPTESSLAKSVVMQARFRKGVLPESQSLGSAESASDDMIQNLRMGQLPSISFSNALTCLRNAHTLGGDDRNFVSLLSAIHELTAFVSLQLRSPGLALRAATAILTLPQSSSNPYLYIKGALLKAEALVALGQVHQAIALLDQITAAGQTMSSQILGLTTVAYNASLLHAKVGNVQKAIDIYEQMKGMTCTDSNISHFIALERYLQSLVKRSRTTNAFASMFDVSESRRYEYDS